MGIGLRAGAIAVLSGILGMASGAPQPRPTPIYAGFDCNVYPGDATMAALRRTFLFTGYWLSPPPGAASNSWRGRRARLAALGFGFLLLYNGHADRDHANGAGATAAGDEDATRAAAAARREGFDRGAVIFLDIEEGGRLSPAQYAYLAAWADELSRHGNRPGIYCSAILVRETGGTWITTANDIRNHLGSRAIVYWVYNDRCPPSPGCSFPAPPPTASGDRFAAVWQCAQSPRRAAFTARCAATYGAEGDCQAPTAATPQGLDLDSALAPNPSGN